MIMNLSQPDGLYQITLHYGCFGLVVTGNTVTDVAPMGKWMRGKRAGYVKGWVLSKGGTMERVAA